MQTCNLECEHAICNSKMSIKTADLEDLLSNKNQFKSTEIVIKCDVLKPSRIMVECLTDPVD